MIITRSSLWRYLALALCYCAGGFPLFGFALLGPFAPWMDPAFYYRAPGDLGGPMDINEGYRWNVPVVTYGFDQEFMEYFGEEGVAAIEEAVAMLNELPPASEMDIDVFPFSGFANDLAAALLVIDLKSGALGALLQQFGLADAVRNTWSIHHRTIDEQGTNYTLIERNFDPVTFEASSYVNGNLLVYQIFSFRYGDREFTDAIESSADQVPHFFYHPVTGQSPYYGWFYTGLTRDDAGGLRFLLSKENRKVERLLPGVVAGPENSNGVVNVALRPGVEKINLVRMSMSTGRFVPTTNVFVDTFFTNGIATHQQLQRVITQPDIVFRARDLGLRFFFRTNGPPSVGALLWTASDTSNWQNNAALNGQPAAAGPGIIRPSAEITFNKIGRYATANILPPHSTLPPWGSFDENPDSITVYNGHETATSASVSMRVVPEGGQTFFEWQLLVRSNATYRIDSTTDLKEWTTAGSLTATNTNFATFRSPVTGPTRCYRAVLESAP